MLGSLLTAVFTCLSTLVGKRQRQQQSSAKPTFSKSGTSDSTALPYLPPPLPLPLPPPLTHFSLFLNLPLEIREMIWKFALPEPRQLKVPSDFDDLECYAIENHVNFHVPLSQACFESRRVMFEAGYRLVHAGDASPDTGVWFCEERGDTVSIEMPREPMRFIS
ncbi:hypothetical protein F4679DRAFT_588972 [Xylaria curta]|nr:hypothetical protein F4679DRAFT_588972 [Xylaria curta]